MEQELIVAEITKNWINSKPADGNDLIKRVEIFDSYVFGSAYRNNHCYFPKSYFVMQQARTAGIYFRFAN
jgi:hypothetical protein